MIWGIDDVVGRDVQVAEQLCGDGVVAAFGEVARADEVAAAEVHADVHVGRGAGEAVVVEGDVGVEECGGVFVVVAETCEHLLRAEIYGGCQAFWATVGAWGMRRQARFGSSIWTFRRPASYRIWSSVL